MSYEDYWLECVTCACDEAGVVATAAQLRELAEAVQISHENYGMAFYQPSSSDHYQPKIDKLKRELKIERSKEHCRECNGRGRIYTQGRYHGSDSQCPKCHGEGKRLP